jgi:hypothetical protein
MKNILLFLIFSLYSVTIFGQIYNKVLKEQSLIEGQTIYLNSKTRIGGKNRIVIPIRLPANTVAWYYSFTTLATNTSATQIDGGQKLSTQLASLISGGAISASGVSVVGNIAYQIIKPTGSGSVDIYLTDRNGLQQFEQTDALGTYNYDVPAFYREGTAQNYRNGTFHIQLLRNDLFLCLRNPSPTEGVVVSLDIVALVTTEEYKDTWAGSSIDLLYNNCLASFANQNNEAEQICSCYKNKITLNYTPSNYNNLSTTEKNMIFEDYINKCSIETGNQATVDKDKRVKDLSELLRGQRVTKDYSSQEQTLLELVSIGLNSWNTYNSLAYCQLCLKKYDDAKKNLQIGLGKNPNDLFLLGNLANYYLLTGKYEQAIEMFKEYSNKKLADKRRFKEAVEEDLKEFERLGLSNSDFVSVRKELHIK